MEKKNNEAKILFDWLGGVAAFLTLIIYALLVINANWPFLPENITAILEIIRPWAPLIVVGLAGIEATRGTSFIVKLVFYILLAVVVLAMIFPETWYKVVGIINGK